MVHDLCVFGLCMMFINLWLVSYIDYKTTLYDSLKVVDHMVNVVRPPKGMLARGMTNFPQKANGQNLVEQNVQL